MPKSFDHNDIDLSLLKNIREKAFTYLEGRRLDTGGFSYFKSWGAGFASTLDTHAALLAFSFLDDVRENSWLSDEKTRLWIRERLLLELSFQDIIGVWHLCASIHLMRDRLSEDERLLLLLFLKKTSTHFFHEKTSAGEIRRSDSLSSLIAWNRLADLSGWKGERPVCPVSDNSHADLLERFYRWEMNGSGWYPGQVFQPVDLSPFESELFGYVLTGESTATDMAVISCGALIAAKDGGGGSHLKQVFEWVIDSQCASGGFGRIPGAVPDLISTAQALLMMELIENGAGRLEILFSGGYWWSLQEN